MDPQRAKLDTKCGNNKKLKMCLQIYIIVSQDTNFLVNRDTNIIVYDTLLDVKPLDTIYSANR